MNIVGEWVDRVHQPKSLKQIILDMDSSVSPTYGDQEGSAYNGYFACTCYHSLFCFNQFDDLERALLRNGNVHSADDWRSLLEPIVNRYRAYDILQFFRGNAAFADPKMYRYLEAEGYFYAIQLKENPIRCLKYFDTFFKIMYRQVRAVRPNSDDLRKASFEFI